jgi:HEAT repeat protein
MRGIGSNRRPGVAVRRWLVLVLGSALLLGGSGCGLRTIPPIRYVPIIGKEKDITTTQVLSKALKDRDLGVRAQAVKLLGILSQSSDNKIKKAAAKILGVAARDSDPGIRLQAIESLGKMEEKYGNKYLLAALKDPNPFVRERVLQVLNERQAQLGNSS